MRFRCFLIGAVVGISASAGATAALADWQYTRWGMTPDEVVAASNGQVHLGSLNLPFPVPTNPEPIGALGTYATGGLSFESAFSFREGRLSKVDLNISHNETDCLALRDMLASAYGAPFRDLPEASEMTIWHDLKRKNKVTLMAERGSGVCTVAYAPLVSAPDDGL